MVEKENEIIDTIGKTLEEQSYSVYFCNDIITEFHPFFID